MTEPVASDEMVEKLWMAAAEAGVQFHCNGRDVTPGLRAGLTAALEYYRRQRVEAPTSWTGRPTVADPCVFCDGALGNERLTQSPGFLALVDAHPVSPGHALVVPRRHAVSLFELAGDEVAEAFGLLAEARALIDAAYSPTAYNVGINDGTAAGRTVHHLHIHLIPRYAGDVPDPRGGVRLILPGPSPDLWSDRPTTGAHVYLSTGCHHGRHDYCAAMTGWQGEKRPAICKFCPAPCVCRCHATGGDR